MDERALQQFLIELGGENFFNNTAEVIAIFDTDGNGTLDEDEVQVTGPIMMQPLVCFARPLSPLTVAGCC
jgi:hypothetical protein